MNTAIIKNTLRKVWKTKGRFLAITAIIAIGSGFFTGVKVTGPSMKATAAKYYEDTNLMDFRFVSTLGFDQSDIDNIKSLEGVAEIEPGYTADLFYQTDDRFDSIIKIYSYNEDNKINIPTLASGQMPKSADECVIDDELAKDFPIGSTIRLSGESDVQVSDYLESDEFKVVGTVDWSMYIDFERGSTSLGNGKISAFMLVPDEAFSIEAYTSVYIKCAELDGVDPFSDEFKDISEEKAAYFESCMQSLADKKSEKIYNDAVNNSDFVKALSDYEQGLAEYNEAFSEYETQLAELEKFISDVNIQIADYTELIENATAEYENGVAEYNLAADELLQEQKALEEREIVLDEDEALIHAQAEFLDNSDNKNPLYLVQLKYGNQTLQEPYPDDIVQLLENAKILDTQYLDFSGTLENFLTASIDGKKEAQLLLERCIDDYKEDENEIYSVELRKQSVESERAAIENERNALAQVQLQLDETELALENARLEINTNQATLDGYIEQVSLAQGEIANITHEADAAFGEQKDQLDKAKAEIDNAYDEFEALAADVEWYSFGRNSNIGYGDFETNADRVDSIARVFPIFFIIVAILVCLTTMARMIEEERVEIGTLKALGYSRLSILAQYISYAACASILGVAIGLLAGVSIIPKVIYMAYLLMYILPDMQLQFPVDYAVGCTAVSLFCTIATVLISCSKALCEVPAALMRPKAPKNGKRVLLERAGFVWKHLSFNAKVTARNVFRFKSRVFMTVIGICGCTALLLAGFTLKYAISAVVDKQFGEIFKYDALIYHDDKVDLSELDVVLASNENITDYTSALQKSYEISANGKSYDGYVVVPDDANAIKDFVNIRNPETDDEINITGAGAVINEKLAQVLDVSVGDEIDIGEKKTSIKVSAITENYTFNYVYMSKALYAAHFGEERTNVIYANLEDNTDSDALFEELSDALADSKGTLNVTFTKDSGKSFRELVDTLDYIVLVVIISSGALAFVVLYNLNNINIVERMRELATLKVLGFYDGELSAYIYRETTITALLGALAGLFVGTFFTKFVVITAEVDVVMFARDIPPYCYLLAFFVTLLFVALVDAIMYIKLKNIDMAASMKAVE